MITDIQNKCLICCKRIISTAYKLNCKICNKTCHKLCVPGVNKYEDFYTNYNDDNWYCPICNQDIMAFNNIDDDNEFISALSEMWEWSVSFSLDELNQKVFVPFEMNTEEEYHPLFQTDPDINYYNTISNQIHHSDYYLEDSFAHQIKRRMIDSKCFSMIHCNILSLPKHLHTFENYIESLGFKFKIVAFSETWLNETTFALYNIPEYNMEHNFRSERRGGGVGLYIHNSIEYSLRTDLDIFNDIIESKFIQIRKESFGTDQDIVVGVIYRPPNTDLKTFNEICSTLVSKLQSESKLVYLAGDYNINLLSAERHFLTSGFLEIMFSNMFVPLINKPTRITNTSATIIDNIFTNCKKFDDSFSGILYTDMTDHLPIFYIDKIHTSSVTEDDTYITRRSYSSRNVENFKSSLSSIDWNDVLCIEDPQIAYTTFFNKLTGIYNKCFPLKKVKGKYYNRKTWLTENLKASIKQENKLYARYKKYPNSFNELIYLNYKKSFTENSVVRRA